MTDFITLSQELRALVGVGGSGPTDVTTATGIEKRIVDYIKNAWIDIQSHPKDWKWMWQEGYLPAGGIPLQTILDTPDYVLTDVHKIRVRTFRSYLTATGVSDRQRMLYVPWNEFQRRYGIVVSTSKRPITATRLPNGNLRLVPPPNGIFSIEFEYFTGVQVLSANDSVPLLPSEFHQLIIYEAAKRYGKAEDAQEVVAAAEQEAGSEGSEGKPVSGLWRALIWDQEYRDLDAQSEHEQMTVVPQ